MKDIMIFSDWTAVGQIKNQINPDIKAEASAIIDKCGNSNEIVGYDITIYLRSPYVILYKVKVEMDYEGVWSLTTNQAVEMLNSLGFYCKYELPPYFQDLSDKQISTLQSLKTLQFTHIVRNFENGRGRVFAINVNSPSETFEFNRLNDYNYLDWIFLPLGRPQIIDGILVGNEINNTDDDSDQEGKS